MSKTFVITKKTEFAVVFQYFAEDFAISEYFKIVLIMMVKQTSCCAQQHLLVLIMCLIISSHFTCEHQAGITSCQYHWRPWKFLVLSMNTSALGHKQAYTQAQAQGQAKAHTHLLLPNFFFFVYHVLSLITFSSVIMLFKKKKNSII